jgi:hypothetical protein
LNLKTTRELKNYELYESSKKRKGGWNTITSNKSVQSSKFKNNKFITLSFEKVEKGEGGSPSPVTIKFKILNSKTTREFKALSFKKVERGERGVHHYP